MSPDPIVITGAELVTCLGASREETWRGVVKGRCGMGPMPAMESALPPGSVGGQAVDLPTDFASHLPREVRYLKWTIERALADAKALAQLPYESHRCGLTLGTTLQGIRGGGRFLRNGDHRSLKTFLAGSILESAVSSLGITGFAATTCSACSSSLGSIALAITLLQTRQLDLVVCGGYDPISEYAYGGFNSLRLVAEGPLLPFAKNRQGMKLAEGYGILVLERWQDAKKRDARILSQLLGFGESADAFHLTQPHPEGQGAASAISAALASAHVSPDEIDLIVAHATGTPDNDEAEFRALRSVFKEHLRKTPVVAFKSHLGHTLGGAGAVELILAIVATREQTVPPCANVDPLDTQFPELQLASGLAKSARLHTGVSISLGFGGANTCVVFTSQEKREIPAAHSESGNGRDAYVTGIGTMVPGAVGNDAFLDIIFANRDATCARDTGPIAEEHYIHLLNARRVRRMSEQVKLCLAVAVLALQHAAIDDVPTYAESCCAILGSMHGSANYSASYYREIVSQGIIGANPMLFAEGVPNACSAHLSLMLGAKGACQTIIGTRTSGLDALQLASLRIKSGLWDRAIVATAEEYCETVNAAYRACGLCCGVEGAGPFAGERGFVAGSAAVAFLLESDELSASRNARVYGNLLEGSMSRAKSGIPIWAYAQGLRGTNSPRYIISSANGTWIDRAELLAIERFCPGAVVSTIYGHVAEAFAAAPMLGLAATMLCKKMIPIYGAGSRDWNGLVPATGVETPDSVAALCTDYTGTVSTIRIGLSNDVVQ